MRLPWHIFVYNPPDMFSEKGPEPPDPLENLDLYSRIEEDGEVFYAVSFVEGSCQYFVRGSGDLTKLQELAELYYECVRNGS